MAVKILFDRSSCDSSFKPNKCPYCRSLVWSTVVKKTWFYAKKRKNWKNLSAGVFTNRAHSFDWITWRTILFVLAANGSLHGELGTSLSLSDTDRHTHRLLSLSLSLTLVRTLKHNVCPLSLSLSLSRSDRNSKLRKLGGDGDRTKSSIPVLPKELWSSGWLKTEWSWVQFQLPKFFFHLLIWWRGIKNL